MTAHVLHYLLTAEVPEATVSVDEWWRTNRLTAAQFTDQVDIAAATGFAASSVAFAFGSGYQAALRALVPGLGDAVGAFCATEAGGGHPRAIHTTLDGGLVTGVKTFVTMGTAANQLLVVVREGTGDVLTKPSDRPLLRLVRVNAEHPGVTITDRAPLPVVPELPHGEVRLQSVAPSEILDGDGYAQFVKPFRTVEDIHVSAAILGWLIRVARQSDWPSPTVERLLAAVVTLRALGQASPSSPAVHIALGGAMAAMTDALSSLDTHWASAAAETAAMWKRDKVILEIANRVRATRLASAWSVFASQEEPLRVALQPRATRP